jgi:hypothetical protein
MTSVFAGTLLLSGLMAGFLHVVSGPDHLAAMAPYAVDARARAWRTGVRWGVGHSAGVIGVGLLALLVRDVLAIELVSSWSERFVGVMLVAIGIWGWRAALPKSAKHRQHGPGPDAYAHKHEHPALAVGAVHGLAGSSHLLGVVPALALPSDAAAAAYLLVFGAGSIVAMGTFSSLVGWVAGRAGVVGAKAQGLLLALSSAAAIVVGCHWLFSSHG